MPTALGLLTCVVHKCMMYRIVVNVSDELHKKLVRINEFSVEIWYKKAAFTIVFFVAGLSISVN